MSGNSTRTVGILGAGRVGTALARQALKAGYEVLVATTRPPAEIELLVEVMAPGAKTVTADLAARVSDLVILAVPLAKYRKLDPESLSGKIAIDVMNYWAPTDGTLAEFEGEVSSSEVVQQYLRYTRLVRTLNHIGYHEVEKMLCRQVIPSGALWRLRETTRRHGRPWLSSWIDSATMRSMPACSRPPVHSPLERRSSKGIGSATR
jgi:hypothetical protein